MPGWRECERRDPKGLYARARAGEIANFTGISAPYWPPDHCDLKVQTATQTIEESVAALIRYVQEIFPRRRGNIRLLNEDVTRLAFRTDSSARW